MDPDTKVIDLREPITWQRIKAMREAQRELEWSQRVNVQIAKCFEILDRMEKRAKR